MNNIIDRVNKELEKEIQCVETYRIQDHQRHSDEIYNKHDLFTNTLAEKIGLVNNLNKMLDIVSNDISVVRMKSALYGNSISEFNDESLLEQVVIKIVRIKTLIGMSQDCSKAISEARTYLSFLFNSDIEKVYEEALALIPFKEIYYSSAWRIVSSWTLIDLIMVKINRHLGNGKSDKFFSDMLDIINYLFYLELKEKNK